jgi:hypothetical protein
MGRSTCFCSWRWPPPRSTPAWRGCGGAASTPPCTCPLVTVWRISPRTRCKRSETSGTPPSWAPYPSPGPPCNGKLLWPNNPSISICAGHVTADCAIRFLMELEGRQGLAYACILRVQPPLLCHTCPILFSTCLSNPVFKVTQACAFWFLPSSVLGVYLSCVVKQGTSAFLATSTIYKTH